MAFEMNRPVIKGTALHKASIAKAKAKSTSIVAPYSPHSQDFTTANKSLADSQKVHAIDYSLDMYDLDLPKKDKDKNKEWTDKDTIETIAKNDQISLDEAEQRYQDSLEKKPNITVGKAQVTAFGNTSTERNYTKEEMKRLETDGVFNEDVGRLVLPEEVDSNGNFIPRHDTLGEILTEESKNTPLLKRDDRIFTNAKPGGTVRANLIKSGYVPRNKR